MTATLPRPQRLVLIGSVVADLMMTVPQLPPRGGDVLASRAVLQPGGGFNVLAAARRLGLPAALAGRVGDGPFGRLTAAALAGEGVRQLLPDAAGDSGFTLGLVEPDGERTFVTSPGVESRLTHDDLRLAVRPTPGGAAVDAHYISGYDLCYPQTGPAVAQWAVATAPELLVLDPGPLVGEIPAGVLRPVLRHVAVLTLNTREAAVLVGPAPAAAEPRDVMSRLRDLVSPGAVIVLRDGARGCRLGNPDGDVVAVPAPRVTAVDTTGAGDTHTGALLAELHRTGDLLASVRTATAAAALSVSRAGSATGPTRVELSAWLAAVPAGGDQPGRTAGRAAAAGGRGPGTGAGTEAGGPSGAGT